MYGEAYVNPRIAGPGAGSRSGRAAVFDRAMRRSACLRFTAAGASVALFYEALLIYAALCTPSGSSAYLRTLDHDLIEASASGDVALVRALLGDGARPDLRYPWGRRRPLIRAMQAGSLETMRLLLRAGADPDAPDRDGDLALHLALRVPDNLPTVASLIEAGADVNARSGAGLTPLHIVTQSGALQYLPVILKAGADVNAPDARGFTPLHDAARWGGWDVVQQLLNAGADANRPDAAGRTPLHAAAASPFAVAKLRSLLAAGARIDATDNEGKTPLHLAVRSLGEFTGRHTIRELLRAGARPDAIDGHGLRPLDEATSAARREAARSLMQTAVAGRPARSAPAADGAVVPRMGDQTGAASAGSGSSMTDVLVFVVDSAFEEPPRDDAPEAEPADRLPAGHGEVMRRTIRRYYDGEIRRLDVETFGLDSRGLAQAFARVRDHAQQHPGKRLVVNVSLGGSAGAATDRICTQLAEMGVVLVAAVGNEGRRWCCFPAAHPNVVSVASAFRTPQAYVRSSYSNYGDAVDIAIVQELNYGPGGSGGTSTATAMATGLIATALAADPGLPVPDVLAGLPSGGRPAQGFPPHVKVVDPEVAADRRAGLRPAVN